MEDEVWKPVPSIPGVDASSLGRIRSLPKIVPMPNGHGSRIRMREPTFGYLAPNGRHQITAGGTTKRVSMLVCEAFHGPRPSPKHECMHLDEDAKNNRPQNLAWGTRFENQSSPKLLIKKSTNLLEGKWFKNWKLTDEDRAEIIQLIGMLSVKQIAEQFGIHRATVYSIIRSQGVK